MILLTLIAVGLLTLSSIYLRTTAQDEPKQTAQANSKMALMLALGDLQEKLGPDSRISAPSNVGAPSGGSPNWTAVYKSWALSNSGTPETPASRGNPEFLGWLASGANQATGGPPGTDDRIVLLGPGSLGGSKDPALQVQVPMHVINIPKHKGRFAWWVADEGTKAKINAGPDQLASASLGRPAPLFHSQSPPYPGHQMIPPLKDFVWKDGQRAITLSKATVALAADIASDSLGVYAHDYTVHSAGVLADVRTGRLKRDLSNLLARPVDQLENKPLYLANGNVNWFSIDAAGNVTNSLNTTSGISANNTASQWGINLEELYLFHSLSKNLTWSDGKPTLEMKNSREEAVTDRHFLYKRPPMQALQFILSLQAVPDTAKDKYKMVMKLDAMVAVGNPNDIPLVIPPGVALPFQLVNIPYDLVWNIQKSAGGALTTTTTAKLLSLFKGYLEGGVSGQPAAGFRLEPGEAAVFGSSSASGVDLNLRRGFVPSGGVEITTWNLQAGNLSLTDQVDFEFKRITAKTTYGWAGYNTWVGPRSASVPLKGWQTDGLTLDGGSLSGKLVDEEMLPSIKPPQVRPVSDFVSKAQPVLMLSFLQNVEGTGNGLTPDAFASRPFQLGESSVNGRTLNPDTMQQDRHGEQFLVTAEPMNYQFRTLAAGAGGRNLYIGGGRQPNLGGTFNVISRRIPLAPPLSIGAFQNAIASGFCGRFSDAGLAIGDDPFPSNAVALCGRIFGTPLVSHAIGNSNGLPQLAPNEVIHNGKVPGSRFNFSTDHSWMVNTALWDAWFLSGIDDGTGGASSPWMTDGRSARTQFTDFASGKKPLRNTRFLFHPFMTAEKAASELFNGDVFKDSAINLLPKYLLVDGAFNVNSTSAKAWAVQLASVRNQELITASGSTRSFKHPFGTLGYAASDRTTGTQGDWSGLRDLSEKEITTLAEAIVTEVKDRGPFLSMADFVNRRPNASEPAHQALGALQAAINRSGLNDRLTTGNRQATAGDFAGLAGAGLMAAEAAPAKAVASRGYLSQADLLTALGPQLAVRSDTFVIRGYGDARDATDKIVARAWCEAVIQRLPDYVDPSDNPEAQDGWPNPSDKLSIVNSKFGRKFQIISFRWLTPAEI